MNGYGIKYKCDFTSLKGINYKIYILQKDYDSAQIAIRMGGNPVQMNYTNSSENKFEIIRGSECILNFFSEYDGQFTELLTADKYEYLVQVLKNDMLEWQGYVIQDNYNEPFQSAPYMISLRATDGLGDLKLIDYALDNGSVYLQEQTFMDTILICLSKLKNAEQLVTSIDLFETRIDRNVVTNESLNQMTVNPFIYLQSELTGKKCDEVIKMILELFQCYIFYKSGKFYIERISYKSKAVISKRTYNIAFTGSQSVSNTYSTGTTRSTISRNGLLKFINSDHNSTYSSAYNKVIASSDVQNPNNLVANNLLRYWDGSTPYNWLKSGNISISQINYPRSGAALQVNSIVDDGLISYTTDMLKPVKAGYQGSVTSEDKLNIKLASLGNVRFMVRAITSGHTYYMRSSGFTENNEYKYDAWFAEGTAFCKIPQRSIARDENDEPSFFFADLTALLPPDINDLDIGIMPSFIGTFNTNPCIIREFTTNLVAGDQQRSYGDQYTIISTKNVRETYEDYNPELGEFDSKGNTNQVLLITSTGKTYSNTWYRDGKTEAKPLFQIGVQSVLNQYRTPYRMFSGTFFGDFDYSKIYEIETLSGLHLPYQANSDLKFDQHKVSFFELLSDEDDETDKFTRLKVFKDGNYSTRTNAVAGGNNPRPGSGSSSGGGRAGRG